MTIKPTHADREAADDLGASLAEKLIPWVNLPDSEKTTLAKTIGIHSEYFIAQLRRAAMVECAKAECAICRVNPETLVESGTEAEGILRFHHRDSRIYFRECFADNIWRLIHTLYPESADGKAE